MLRQLAQSSGGKRICGVPTVGILASTIAAETATGDYGPGLLYDESIAPANAGKQLRCRPTSLPTGGTIFIYENGAVDFLGFPDGLYTLDYDVDADNAYVSSDTATFAVGTTNATALGGTGTGTGAGTGGAVKVSVLSENVVLFNVKALVTSDQLATYSIRAIAQQDVTSDYLILSSGAVTSSSSASYNIRGVASAQGGEAYNIRASAISSGVVGYSIRGEVGAQATSSYTVDSALLAVFASSACAYSVLSDGVWPIPSDVRRGVAYGPNGIDYIGTLSVGTGSGCGINVTLSEQRLIVRVDEPKINVLSRSNEIYVVQTP